jgi:putative transposase
MPCEEVVKPVRRCEVVRHYQDAFALSERRACRAMGSGRASHRYQSRRDPAAELRMRLNELAESRVRYGCRRLHILLQREGWQVNHKRLYRLYSEEGLSIRTRSPKRRRACRYRSGRSEADAKNDVWAMDFMSDKLFDRRPFRILTTVGLPHERGSRDGCEDELPGLPGHRRTRRYRLDQGQAAQHTGRQRPTSGMDGLRRAAGPC